MTKPGVGVVILFCVVRHAQPGAECAGRKRKKGPATKRLPALFKQLESAVLNYQEDLVMPGSSPR